MTALDLSIMCGMLMPNSSSRGASSSIDGYCESVVGCWGVMTELGMNMLIADMLKGAAGAEVLLLGFGLDIMVGALESIAPERKDGCCCCCCCCVVLFWKNPDPGCIGAAFACGCCCCCVDWFPNPELV